MGKIQTGSQYTAWWLWFGVYLLGGAGREMADPFGMKKEEAAAST